MAIQAGSTNHMQAGIKTCKRLTFLPAPVVLVLSNVPWNPDSRSSTASGHIRWMSSARRTP